MLWSCDCPHPFPTGAGRVAGSCRTSNLPEAIMPGLLRGRFAPWLVAALLPAAPAPLAAHPHAWIESTVTLQFDGRQRLAAIETVWVFDEIYSAGEVEGRDRNRDGKFSPEELEPLAAKDVKQLHDWGYFTVLKAAGKRIALGPASGYSMSFEKERLRLTIRLPLAEPVDPRLGEIRISSFDPTFYIEMTPEKERPVRFSGTVAKDCKARVDRLDPDKPATVPDATAMAMTLDPKDPESSIGAEFAEWVVLTCGKPS